MIRTPAALILTAFVCLCACVDGAPPDGAADTDAEDSVEGDVLTIPLEPVTERALLLWPQTSEPDSEGVFQLTERTFVLASGLDYPQAFHVSPHIKVCRPEEGTLEVLEVSPTDAGFEVTEDGRVRVDTSVAGRRTATITGTYRVKEEAKRSGCYDQFIEHDTIPFSVPLTVDVRAVTGIAIETCVETSTLGVLTGQTLRGRPFPTDASGSAFEPENAHFMRAVTVSLIGETDSLDPSRVAGELPTLERILFPEEPLSYSLRGETGPSLDLHVVEPHQLTEVGLYMQLDPGDSDAFPVVDGQRYGADVLAGSYDRLFTSTTLPLFAEDIPVCSILPSELVELHSDTPETCAAERKKWVVKGLQLNDPHIGTSAKLLEDGKCTLRISAPSLNHGEGIETSLTAEFLGVSEMRSLDPPEDSEPR